MAGFFSPSLLDQIRSANDIVEVIGSSVPLKRAGANFVALCPFHKEKSPSFYVNPQKQTFHCFGCHKGGNVFTFIKEYENIGFTDAVRRLAERAKIPIEFDNQPGQQEARHVKDALLQIHDDITKRWQTALTNDAGGQIARDYLKKRGVSDDAVKLFRLGYAPEAWDDTVNWAKSKGHELPLVEQAGLILRKEGTDRFYDRFRGRLIFPICDDQGRVIGFSGRILSGDEKTAKYVNSPETPIFTKGKVFFGLDKSKRALLDTHTAIVCEGQLDLIACFMAGIKNVIAPQGTALTTDHARILKRYADEVVLCFDSDNAGQNAAIRSLDSLLAAGLAVRVATVPAPHDPDSFIKQSGGEAFQKLIDHAEEFFDFYLTRLCKLNDVNTDKGRLTIVKGMAEAVHKTNNAVLLDKYTQKTAIRLGVSAEAVRGEFKKTPRAFAAQPTERSDELDEDVPEVARPSVHEFWILKLLFLNDDLAEWLQAHLEPDWIQHVHVRNIVAQRCDAFRDDTWRGLAAFLEEIDEPQIAALVTEAVADEKALAEPLKQLSDVLLRLRNQSIDRKIAAHTSSLGQTTLGDEARAAILQEQQQLRLLKHQPLAPINSADEY